MICSSQAMLLYVNRLLDDGISNSGIAAGVVDMGGKLDPEVVGRHKNNHWVKPVRTEGPKPTKRDLAVLTRDKVYDMVEDLTPDALMVLGKDVAPMIGKGLAAQTILDKRDVNEKRLGLAAGALSLQAWLAGLGGNTPPPPELDDGRTVEGEYEDLSP